MIFDKIEALTSLGYQFYGSEENGFTFLNGQTPPTEKEIDTEVKRLQAEYDAQEYSRKREAEYPSIKECVHAILDDDLDALQAKRVEIKTKYPKGD
tara:strand:+ start:632 stop:919 length:288 start_codon:yes stop_codon:yes gene_type:complete